MSWFSGDVFSVPPLEAEPWPSLGWLLVPWMEKHLVFGPGDLRGEKLRLSPERKALIYRMYEVFPKGHPNAGRRRFRRAAISVRKGVGKTELAALIAAAELSPRAPVRCTGFDGKGRPLGGPVTDPYIPIVAYTEEQSEDLAYGALRVILGLSPDAKDFDIGLERIMRRGGDGKAVALATAPDSRDGARTTFQVADETHRWTLARLRQAHQTMLANLPKRRKADPWALEVTTAPAPGEDSVAERTMQYARTVADGEKLDARLFFFHRQASDGHDLSTLDGVRAAVVEASGPDAEWSDIEGIVEQFDDPSADRAYLERVWLNRLRQSSASAFDSLRWGTLAATRIVPDGALITLGFDGSRRLDASALVATEIETGYQWPIRIWERPATAEEGWEIPEAEVHEAVAEAFKRWEVWRMYADPPYWESQVAAWSGQYGEERVVSWWTNKWRRMAEALRAFAHAIIHGEVSHSGDERLAIHIGNARRQDLQMRTDDGQPLWIITKDRRDSPEKIDGAMAACLSWTARRDAIALGIDGKPKPAWDGRVMVLA